jgi:hypothetical protein
MLAPMSNAGGGDPLGPPDSLGPLVAPGAGEVPGVATPTVSPGIGDSGGGDSPGATEPAGRSEAPGPLEPAGVTD